MRIFKIIIFLGFFSAFLLNAESNTCPPKKVKKADEDKKQSMKMYNSPARVDTNGWDFFIRGDFLYWQPLEEATDLCYLDKTSISFSEIEGTEKVYSMKKDFKPAFKVAIGTSFDYDDWCLMGKYLFFHSNQTKTVKNPDTDNYSLENYWMSVLNNANFVKGKWKLYMDLVDISLSRPCFVGKNFTLSPSFAIEFGRIKQKYKVYESANLFIGDDNINARTNSKSSLIGPKLGIEGNWLLGSGFSIKNDIFASLFYQRIKLKYSEVSTTDYFKLQQISKKKVHQVIPNLEIFAGLNWGSYFCEKDFHVDLSLGYDFVFFAKQNYMKSLVHSDTFEYAGLAGDLFLHGLNASVRFDF